MRFEFPDKNAPCSCRNVGTVNGGLEFGRNIQKNLIVCDIVALCPFIYELCKRNCNSSGNGSELTLSGRDRIRTGNISIEPSVSGSHQ